MKNPCRKESEPSGGNVILVKNTELGYTEIRKLLATRQEEILCISIRPFPFFIWPMW